MNRSFLFGDTLTRALRSAVGVLVLGSILFIVPVSADDPYPCGDCCDTDACQYPPLQPAPLPPAPPPCWWYGCRS